jgi:signal peptidase I
MNNKMVDSQKGGYFCCLEMDFLTDEKIDLDEMDQNNSKSRLLRLQSFLQSMSLIFFIIAFFGFRSCVLDLVHIPSPSMIPALLTGDYIIVNKLSYSLRIPFTKVRLLHFSDPKRGEIITFLTPAHTQGGRYYIKRVIGLPGDRIRIRYLSVSDHPPSLKKKAPVDPGELLTAHRITVIQYRISDQGPWLTALDNIAEEGQAKKILSGSDSVYMLFPESFPGGWKRESPVVTKEYLISGNQDEPENHRSYYTVTIASGSDSPSLSGQLTESLCPEILYSGCVIPQDQYFVMGDNRSQSKDSRFFGFVPGNTVTGRAAMIAFSLNWHDSLCREYAKYFIYGRLSPKGFKTDDFSRQDQNRFCAAMDNNQTNEMLPDYIARTLMYRWQRVTYRRNRAGHLL